MKYTEKYVHESRRPKVIEIVYCSVKRKVVYSLVFPKRYHNRGL